MAPCEHPRPPGEAGRAGPHRLLEIRDTPLSLDEVFGPSAPTRRADRALRGTVRITTAVRTSTPSGTPCISAEAEMRRVAEKVVAGLSVRALAAVHRWATSRWATWPSSSAVSCPHRGEAFESLPQADRRPQARSPDLEAPEFSDGTEEWVGPVTPEPLIA